MAKLYSSKQIIKTLLKIGFLIVSQKGSHLKLQKNSLEKVIVIVPVNRKTVPQGTFRSILRQAKINIENFQNLQ